ncbi:MAG: hypothetical protein CM1200mP20_00170 [Pseudomonadota bacterium]|nr:MAG: hypothetical protein CM1200mP20_00170 [Pseudomonadota bacterium]
MIEDIAAWENLDEIIEVDHIDVFFVAPGDFAASMGHTRDLYHPEVQEKVNDALSRISMPGVLRAPLPPARRSRVFFEMGVAFSMSRSSPGWRPGLGT